MLDVHIHTNCSPSSDFHLVFISSFNRYLKPSNNRATKAQLPVIPTVTFRFPPAVLGSEPALFTMLLSMTEIKTRACTPHAP